LIFIFVALTYILLHITLYILSLNSFACLSMQLFALCPTNAQFKAYTLMALALGTLALAVGVL
jgi:hypothetical protein